MNWGLNAPTLKGKGKSFTSCTVTRLMTRCPVETLSANAARTVTQLAGNYEESEKCVGEASCVCDVIVVETWLHSRFLRTSVTHKMLTSTKTPLGVEDSSYSYFAQNLMPFQSTPSTLPTLQRTLMLFIIRILTNTHTKCEKEM